MIERIHRGRHKETDDNNNAERKPRQVDALFYDVNSKEWQSTEILIAKARGRPEYPL